MYVCESCEPCVVGWCAVIITNREGPFKFANLKMPEKIKSLKIPTCFMTCLNLQIAHKIMQKLILSFSNCRYWCTYLAQIFATGTVILEFSWLHTHCTTRSKHISLCLDSMNYLQKENCKRAKRHLRELLKQLELHMCSCRRPHLQLRIKLSCVYTNYR